MPAKMTVIGVRMPDEMIEQLKDLSDRWSLPYAEFIRCVVGRAIKDHGKKTNISPPRFMRPYRY